MPSPTRAVGWSPAFRGTRPPDELRPSSAPLRLDGGGDGGSLLQRARTTWLDGLVDRRGVLSAGEGHGKFASAFVNRFPDAQLTCVEASSRMLERARRRTSSSGTPVQWNHAALPAWSLPPRSFDAVVTCFFLDCFTREQLRAVVAALAASATDDAAWLVVDFAVPERGIAHGRARAIHAVMYGFFRAATQLPARRLTPPDEFLRGHRFQLAGRREFSWGLLRADLWLRQAG